MAVTKKQHWTDGLRKDTAQVLRKDYISVEHVRRAVSSGRLKPGAVKGYAAGRHKEVVAWLAKIPEETLAGLAKILEETMAGMMEDTYKAWDMPRIEMAALPLARQRKIKAIRELLDSIARRAEWTWAIGPWRALGQRYRWLSYQLGGTKYRIVIERDQRGDGLNAALLRRHDDDTWGFETCAATREQAEKRAYARLLWDGISGVHEATVFTAAVNLAHSGMKGLYPTCFKTGTEQ